MTGRDVITDFHRRATADEDRLLELRLGLGVWIGELGLERHTAEDVMLASYEAMANAVEHAYRGGPGDMDLRGRIGDGVLTVTVTDWGRWRPYDDRDPARGRGLILVRGLSHRSELHHRDDGTTVEMVWVVPPGRA
jgi:anti-sigma regulatory factor (Ser/Thr protein kinase)